MSKKLTFFEYFCGVMFTLVFLGSALIVLLGLLYFIKKEGLSRFGIALSWSVKLIAAFALLFVYTSIYPKRSDADIFKYFDDARVLSSIHHENPGLFYRTMTGCWTNKDLPEINKMNYWFRSYDHGLINDNRIIIRINAVFNLITRGNYALNLCLFLWCSWMGSYWLFRFFIHYSSSKLMAFIAAFLIPSTIFWSSGILKESILCFALGGFLYFLHKALDTKRIHWYLAMTPMMAILLVLKIYLIVLLLPFLCLFLIWQWKQSKPVLLISFISLLAIYALTNLVLFPNFDFLSALQGKQHDFIQMAKMVKAGSLVPIVPFDGSWSTFFLLIPMGIWNVIIYPTLSMVHSPQTLLAFMENMIFIVLFILALINCILCRPLIDWRLFFLFFCLSVFALVGSTAPVVGAMVRYKSPILPFLLLSLWHYQPQVLLDFFKQKRIALWFNTHL